MKHLGNRSLREHFHYPDFIVRNSIDEILRGLLMEPIKDTDNQFTEEIRNHLFEEKNKPFSGLDLIALNIQRARAHEISGCNFYRSVFGLKKASSFNSLNSEIEEKTVIEISKVYRHPDDIDLYWNCV